MTAAPSPERILVVDDEADISTVLSITLKRAGYEVTTARDGMEALERVAEKTPDLILLDVMMPRLDGIETLRRLRGAPQTAGIPVIMLTAKARTEDRVAGFDVGADDYVAKPFAPAEVLARVRSLLRRTEQTRLTTPLMGLLGDWASAEGVAQLGRDLDAAREIQTRLLPAIPPRLAGLEAAGLVRPSTVVGGDFYDIVPMRDRVGLAVGDVSGKGVPGALLMVMVRTLLREVAAGLREPAEVLTRLNASLCRDMPPSMFVTIGFVVLDPAREGELRIACGGHPAPVRLGRGEPAAVDVGGTIVGAFTEATFDEASVTLAAGESLVLVTDGIIEAPVVDGRRRDFDGFCRALRDIPAGAAASLATAIADAAQAAAAGRTRDDLTVVVLRRP